MARRRVSDAEENTNPGLDSIVADYGTGGRLGTLDDEGLWLGDHFNIGGVDYVQAGKQAGIYETAGIKMIDDPVRGKLVPYDATVKVGRATSDSLEDKVLPAVGMALMGGMAFAGASGLIGAEAAGSGALGAGAAGAETGIAGLTTADLAGEGLFTGLTNAQVAGAAGGLEGVGGSGLITGGTGSGTLIGEAGTTALGDSGVAGLTNADLAGEGWFTGLTPEQAAGAAGGLEGASGAAAGETFVDPWSMEPDPYQTYQPPQYQPGGSGFPNTPPGGKSILDWIKDNDKVSAAALTVGGGILSGAMKSDAAAEAAQAAAEARIAEMEATRNRMRADNNLQGLKLNRLTPTGAVIRRPGELPNIGLIRSNMNTPTRA